MEEERDPIIRNIFARINAAESECGRAEKMMAEEDVDGYRALIINQVNYLSREALGIACMETTLLSRLV